jgi:hypothetical protein
MTVGEGAIIPQVTVAFETKSGAALLEMVFAEVREGVPQLAESRSHTHPTKCRRLLPTSYLAQTTAFSL